MRNKTPVLCCTCATLVLSPLSSIFAGDYEQRSSRRVETYSSVEGVAEHELARREEKVASAKEAIKAGDFAMKQRDYETAYAQYKRPLDPSRPTDYLAESKATRSIRARARDGLCDAACALAEQRIAEGRYQDAKNICEDVLKPEYDPHCRRAVVILAHLEDPDYYNQTITPGFRGRVEEVKRLLREAEGFYQTGRYDMAMKRCDQVLNIDPYNIAARKLQERTNLQRDNYAVQGYNEYRSRALWQLDTAWQSPVRRFGLKEGGGVYGPTATNVRGTEAITEKLNSIIIPRIEFREATVREAVDFLKIKSRELDKEPDPAKRGVNIVLKIESGGGAAPVAPVAPAEGVPSAEGALPGLTDTAPAAPTVPLSNPADTRITLSLQNIPLIEALRYITNLANLKIKIDPYAVAIVPITEQTETLITKEYKVPPGFISTAPQAAASGSLTGAGTTGTPDATRGGVSPITQRQTAREYLEAAGVVFPPGATANYLASSSRLIVKNTQSNLDLIDALVEASSQAIPKQVEIEAKFVEISQNNLKELSFSTLIGPSNIPGTDPGNGSQGRLLVGGGTTGNQGAVNQGDFPFSTSGLQPLNGGVRSGTLAISANAIDALLFPSAGTGAVAPGILALQGRLTDPQFQIVMRAINQKKGVDLLSAPRVTTKSGQRAVIEIIREFRYPTEFQPPEIPQNIGSSQGQALAAGVPPTFPVTPTTPTAFETRNTGVTLEVEPTVGPDGYTIDLNLVPQVVEFEGFINYGSPIRTINPSAFGGVVAAVANQPQSVVLTENVINQPIFSTRKVTTSVSIWDGQTVVIGGLMREDVQKVEDKVPLFGDIPLLGRFFRSSVDQHLKRNLVIFVTARLINPAGEVVQQVDEVEEVVQPLPLPSAPVAPLPEAPIFLK